MNCLFIHNRRTSGPKESSWFTFHHISRELERRGHNVMKYSVDFDMTTDNGEHITDKQWNSADCIFTVFRDVSGPLKIARARHIASFLEINYACGEIVQPFMEKEVARMGGGKDELIYDYIGAGRKNYQTATFVVGAGNKNYTEKTYRDYGIDNIRMFPAGIDHDYFVPRFELRGKNKIRFTLTAASLNFRKGIVHVSKAWELLPKKYHDQIELHLFGKAPLYAKISQDAFDNLLRHKNVIHHGLVSNQTPNYVHEHAISDVMLCPTLAEGHSATALEGISFGLFAIVSPFTGSDFENFPSKLLSPNPANWIEEIRDGIIFAVDNYDKIKLDMPKIRQYATEKYDWKNFDNEFVNFIEENTKTNKKDA